MGGIHDEWVPPRVLKQGEYMPEEIVEEVVVTKKKKKEDAKARDILLTKVCNDMLKEIVDNVMNQHNITERKARRSSHAAEIYFQKSIGFLHYAEKLQKDKGVVVLAYSDVVENAKLDRLCKILSKEKLWL
jgi:phage terminase large subunit GpA-like protein